MLIMQVSFVASKIILGVYFVHKLQSRNPYMGVIIDNIGYSKWSENGYGLDDHYITDDSEYYETVVLHDYILVVQDLMANESFVHRLIYKLKNWITQYGYYFK